MAAPLSYAIIDRVIESWNKARYMPNFDEVAGKLVLTRLFAISPEARATFGLPSNLSSDDKRFATQGSLIMVMMDTLVDLLGPDMEVMNENLASMGDIHAKFATQPRLFESLGTAMVDTFEELMGAGNFSAADRDAWIETFKYIVAGVRKGSK